MPDALANEPHERGDGWRRASPWTHVAEHGFGAVLEDRSVEVVVVGAGIAGLLTALLLQRSGAEVLVVDRHEIGGVATRNTTAKVTALQATRYSEIASARDSDAAAAYGAAQLDAVRGIRQLIDDEGIECAKTEAAAYTHATTNRGAERAGAEYDAARAAGLDVNWTTATDLPFPVQGAVEMADQFHIDPGALCDGFASAIGRSHLSPHTPVAAIDEDAHHCTVTLESGPVVTSEHVVIATQAPIVDPGFLANRCKAMQSYALSVRLDGDIPDGMYLSCDDETRSLRPAFVNGEKLLIVGGAGHQMGDESATAERWDELGSWTDAHFGAADITHRWATHDLDPTDHTPFIGALTTRSQRRWVATGFGKWGMSNGYVAANIISTALGGGAAPWASTFDSTRAASTVNREFVAAALRAAQGLVVDRFTHRGSPRCTHQGCVLRRDEALETWDCPCHGSRFEMDGSVIQGPAKRRL